ncbi:zinc ribbon domain-containing protein [Streptomyces sp. NPDC012617]|uniref:zinc ribbon domain-containing protein n=1 Tax=Streptomyces sp. NPDC012617 TaxID=3156677 RepID=UPI0033FD4FA6
MRVVRAHAGDRRPFLPLDVSVRAWLCAECGAWHDRDVNAARNLREEGMRLYRLVSCALQSGRVPPPVIKASELPAVLPAV